MTDDHPRRWTRRRLLAGAAATPVLAAVSAKARQARPVAGSSQSSPVPARAQERISARLRLMRVALGQEPADAVIEGGTLLNTVTGELLPGWGVAIAGDRIAAIGDVRR